MGTQSDPRKGDSPATGPGASRNEILDWGLKTAGAIIGGIGTAGAMVVIGSAVLWIRFKEAGLPAIQAVAVQPKQEALVQGAEVTIFFLLAALAAVALMYVIDMGEQKGKTGEPHQIGPRTNRVLFFLFACAVLYLIVGTDLPEGWVWLGSAFAVLLLFGSYLLGRNDQKTFWAFAAAVFVSTLVFAGASGYLIVKEQKYIQSVAILRGQDDLGLTGFYVATTDKKLYFANSIGAGGEMEPERKPMQEVTLDDDVTYSIGPLESLANATARAPAMLKRLIANREADREHKEALNDKKAGGGRQPLKGSAAQAVAGVARAFLRGIVVGRRNTGNRPLCLVRYTDAADPAPRGHWWTSCREAVRLRTVGRVRERLALPSRFQAAYDMRVRGAVPVGARMLILAGHAAAQCQHSPAPPCGHRYAGGGAQFYVPNPMGVRIRGRMCTTVRENRRSRWHHCAK